MMRNKDLLPLHLICNAHIDPVWLWEWDEGVSTVLSTFRVAVEICEKHSMAVFNRNEALIYQCVERHAPELFERVRKLVRSGQWKIMGGWYLQPDCQMPSGESMVRQILVGQRYFKRKFGSIPETAINFDPFGHSSGLPQILAKSGYKNYLICRPSPHFCPLPADEFRWVGLDGSEVIVRRASEMYNSPLGKADEKVKKAFHRRNRDFPECILWGVGNHGGGPSREDMKRLDLLIKHHPEQKIIHSTPDAYFKDLHRCKDQLVTVKGDLSPCFVGCYTSQSRIKQMHRKLESDYILIEKLSTLNSLQTGALYPRRNLEEALKDLLLGQFHDIIPGSSIPAVEEFGMRNFSHGLETLARIKTDLIFKRTVHEKPAKEGEVSIFVWNPHPYPFEQVVDCEMQMQDQNWSENFYDIIVRSNRKQVLSQVEKEISNMPLDWRKRAVFKASLKPGQLARFDCSFKKLAKKRLFQSIPLNNIFKFQNKEMAFEIDLTQNGAMCYRTGGEKILQGTQSPWVVIRDSEDSWGGERSNLGEECGRFQLLSPKQSAIFAGMRRTQELSPVRVIEEGPVRQVIELLWGYSASKICQRIYIPKKGKEIEIEARVFWMEKDKALKFEWETAKSVHRFYGQTHFGHRNLKLDRTEEVFQKWSGVEYGKDRLLTCINLGNYGGDADQTGHRLTLLRSPAYSAHKIEERQILPEDRFIPRMDQGERLFRFFWQAGSKKERLLNIDREAQLHHEGLMVQCVYPIGGKKDYGQTRLKYEIDNPSILVHAFKESENKKGWILRVHNSLSQATYTNVKIGKTVQKIKFKSFEIKTYYWAKKTKTWSEVNLIEE